MRVSIPGTTLARRWTWCTGIVLILTAGLLGCKSKTGPDRPWCKYELKLIGAALYNYHEANGSFPPVVIRDDQGRPMHSWRVLLLPYMEEQKLYEQYDLSQPWDSPHNRALIDKMPDIYRCAKLASAGAGVTPFVAVVGKEAAWTEGEARKLEDFADGRSNTVMVVELPSKATTWTEPEDVPFSDMVGTADGPQRAGTTVNALFADGSVHGLPDDLLSGPLRGAFTRSAGDTFDRSLLRAADEH